MQWIAMLTMLIDHTGLVWFPDSPAWRIIGRIAFPIYTYLIALGLSLTRSVPKYLLRLGALAVVSQLPFTLLFGTWTVNVIGTFFVAAGTIYLMERWSAFPLRFLFPLAAAAFMEVVSFDYGAYGMALLLIYRYTTNHATMLSHIGLNLVYVFLFQAPLQFYSIVPTLAIAYAPGWFASSAYRAPGWLWRAFYPAHLAALYGLAFLTFRS